MLSDFHNNIMHYFDCQILGDSTCGQRALYQLGLTGIPIYNVSQLPIDNIIFLLFK